MLFFYFLFTVLVVTVHYIPDMSLEFRALQPAEFYRQHIERGVRPDGRKLGERRPVAVSSGKV